jgi:hypothetical protein
VTIDTTSSAKKRTVVVRPRPTRTQRFWWGYLAFFGAMSVAGAIGIVDEMGAEDAFIPVIVCCGGLISIGAFASGKLLRQNRAAQATAISISADGTLHVIDLEGDAARSVVGAHALSVDHGRTVDVMYRAKMPSSLASSASYGSIFVDGNEGRHVLVFAGELPRREQEALLSAARPFLASDARTMMPTPTPDEQSDATPASRKFRDLGVMMVTILAFALPGFALIVIQTARRGDLDPNTLWFSVLICVGAVAVLAYGWFRARRR